MSVVRIHPENVNITEYDPFDGDEIIDLGPNDSMLPKEALAVAKRAEFKDVVIVGECGCGCGRFIVFTSKMTRAEANMILDLGKQIVLGEKSNECASEDAG